MSTKQILHILLFFMILFSSFVPIYAEENEENTFHEYISAENINWFCCSDEEISGSLKPIFPAKNNYYGLSSQGFCSAGDYYIYTRYSSDSSSTTYVVIDKSTMKEVGHYEFSTIHSNSLTYNPDKQEVVAVTKSHAFVFSFIDGKLELLHDFIMNHNCCRIAYVHERQCYFMGTDKVIYLTTDFRTLTPYFHYPCVAINQGMGYDGHLIYINWYTPGFNQIYCYTVNGEFVKKYTLRSEKYTEVEEVDFDGSDMILNIAASPGHNGLYKVQSKHTYSDWTSKKKPTCLRYGEKHHFCTYCGAMESQRIDPTGKHEAGDWIVDQEPKCTTKGKRHIECKNCGLYLKEEITEATGHDYGKWNKVKSPNVFSKGQEYKECKNCGEKEYRDIQKLVAFMEIKDDFISIPKDKPYKMKVYLNVGDFLIDAAAKDKDMADIAVENKEMIITPKRTGKTSITIESASGIKKKINIVIKNQFW